MVAERLAVDAIVGTTFIKRHVDAILILCKEKTVKFRKVRIPNVEQGLQK